MQHTQKSLGLQEESLLMYFTKQGKQLNNVFVPDGSLLVQKNIPIHPQSSHFVPKKKIYFSFKKAQHELKLRPLAGCLQTS